MKPPLRAILFDFGGVIAQEGFHQGLRAIGLRTGVDPEVTLTAGVEAVYDSGYVLGRASEGEFWELFRRRTGIAASDEELGREILQRFILRPRMLELVQILREQGYLVAILSDQTDWLDRLDQRDRFLQRFDRVLNSYHLGKGKRDPSIFDDAVRAVGVEPGEALFVDDNIGNLERAAQRGLRVLHFRDEQGAVKALLRLIEQRAEHFEPPQGPRHEE